MKAQSLFFNHKHRLRAFWRILIFVCALFLGISPLLLINNSYIQFFGAVLILISILYLNSRYLDKIDFLEYGLVFKRATFVQLFIGLLIGFFSVVLILLIGESTGIISVTKVKWALNISILLFALKMLFVGILEETFFRGYLFTTIYDGARSGKTANKQALLTGLLISSLIFGFAHVSTSNASFFSTLFLSVNGMVWCIPFILTKNLGMPIGLHTAWNFTQTQIGFTMSGNKAVNSIYQIENTGPDLLTGGEYGPEAGILGLAGYMIMLLLSLTYLILSKKYKNRAP